MTSNALKIIACISMFIDHMGLIIFPEVTIFRAIGRLAMPLFAFFIGEGCLHTKNKFKYFLSVFSLGLLCQAAYEIYEYFGKVTGRCYLNILITFSFSIILCSFYLLLRDSLAKHKTASGALYTLLFFGSLFATLAFIYFTKHSYEFTKIKISLDYSLSGILLPLSVVAFRDSEEKLLSFSIAVTLFSCQKYGLYFHGLYTLFAMLSIFLLCMYNGKRGSRALKYFFYIFYPAHLVILNIAAYILKLTR